MFVLGVLGLGILVDKQEKYDLPRKRVIASPGDHIEPRGHEGNLTAYRRVIVDSGATAIPGVGLATWRAMGVNVLAEWYPGSDRLQ